MPPVLASHSCTGRQQCAGEVLPSGTFWGCSGKGCLLKKKAKAMFKEDLVVALRYDQSQPWEVEVGQQAAGKPELSGCKQMTMVT